MYAGVFERYPNLQMIFPHLGGTAPYLMGRITWGYERFKVCNENLSMPPLEYFKRFHYDTVIRNVPALQMGLTMFGADHIMFGTDCPFDPEGGPMFIREGIRAINSLKLSDADLRKLYYANAIEMLRLDLPASAIRRRKA